MYHARDELEIHTEFGLLDIDVRITFKWVL
jgi:hypothetical protein